SEEGILDRVGGHLGAHILDTVGLAQRVGEVAGGGTGRAVQILAQAVQVVHADFDGGPRVLVDLRGVRVVAHVHARAQVDVVMGHIGRVGDDGDVVAVAAVEGVARAGAGVHGVVTLAADQRVHAVAAFQDVVSVAAV